MGPLYFFILEIRGKNHEIEAMRQIMEGFYSSPTEANFVGEFSYFCVEKILPLPETAWRSKSMTTFLDYTLTVWGTRYTPVCAHEPDASKNRLTYYMSWGCDQFPRRIFEAFVARFPQLKVSGKFKSDRLGRKGHFVSREGKLLVWEQDLYANEKQSRAS